MRRIVCVVLVCVGWLLSSVAQAISLSFVPLKPSIVRGQSTEIILRIDGLGEPGDPPNLGAFDLDVNFDPNIIYLSSVTFQDARFKSGLGDPDHLRYTRGLDPGPPPLPTLDPDSLQPDADSLALATLVNRGTVNLIEVSLLPVDDPVLTQQAKSFILAVLDFRALRLGLSDLTITINGLSDEWGNSFFLPDVQVNNGHVSVSVIDIPEIDAASGTIAIGLLLGVLALLSERRRHPQPEEVAG